jgi:hypothetical protein
VPVEAVAPRAGGGSTAGSRTGRLRPRSILYGAVVAFSILQVAALTRPTDLETAATGFVAGWTLCVALLASRAPAASTRRPPPT